MPTQNNKTRRTGLFSRAAEKTASGKSVQTPLSQEEVRQFFNKEISACRSFEKFAKNWQAMVDLPFEVSEQSGFLYAVGRYYKKLSSDNDTKKMARAVKWLTLNTRNFWRTIHEKTSDMSAYDVNGALLYFKKINVVPFASFIKELENNMANIVKNSPANNSVTIYSLLAENSIKPANQSLYDEVALSYLHELSEENNAEKLRRCLQLMKPYSRYGWVPPSEFIDTMQDYVMEEVSVFTAKTRGREKNYKEALQKLQDKWGAQDKMEEQKKVLAGILHQCAMINCFSNEKNVLRDTATKLYQVLEGFDLESTQNHQWTQAGLWFGCTDKSDWIECDAMTSFIENKLASRMSNVFPDALTTQYMIPNMGHRPDIVIDNQAKSLVLAQNRRLLILEIDGKHHYLRRVGDDANCYVSGDYDGSTIFQTALMHKMEPEAVILRLDMTVCSRLLNLSLHKAELRGGRIANAALRQSPGAYAVKTNASANKPQFIAFPENGEGCNATPVNHDSRPEF